MLLVVMATFGLATLSADAGYPALVVPVVIVGVLLFVLLAIISSALNAIYRSALYLYADTGEIPASFNPDLITGAFRRRKR